MKKSMILCFGLLMSLGSTSQAQSNIEVIKLNKGQRITAVLAKNKPGGDKAQTAYLEGVFRLAEKGTIKPLAYFSVINTLAGEYTPQDFALYAWRNADASHKVREHPNYQKTLKPLQTEGWDELAAADIDLSRTTNYQFDNSKTYTLAEVWLNDAEQYSRYYQGTMALRKQLGAKVVFKHRPNEYNSLKRGEQEPDLLILIEWKNKQDPKKYVQSPLFKDHEKYINAGIQRLGWYELGFENNDSTVY